MATQDPHRRQRLAAARVQRERKPLSRSRAVAPGAPATLPHNFRDTGLLRLALTHRSFAAVHNERLEFVGDAVLDCVIAAELFERFPVLAEGDLSRMRAGLVNAPTLHRLAVGLDLGSYLRLGEGEARSGGAARPSILADALEAIIGAVYVDAGFDAAARFVRALYRDLLENLAPERLGKDAKTRLQEWLQARALPLPEYQVVGVEGEAHARTFEVVCRVAGLGIEVEASATSRRAAEQLAAERALSRIDG